MQSRLIVKNFGPLKDIDVELKNVNVFIGPQASGKSALAKLFTIFKAPRKFLKDFDKDSSIDKSEIYLKAFKDTLEEYNIGSFLREDTEIQFESALHNLTYKYNRIIYEPKLLLKVQELLILKNDFDNNFELIQKLLNGFKDTFPLILIRLIENLKPKPYFERIKDPEFELKNITQEQFLGILNLLIDLELDLSTNTALYIPTERNLSNIIKKSALNLQINNVPIPKHILAFGAELEKVDDNQIDLSFLKKNLFYKSINGEDRVFTSKEHSIKLTEAASGIQSVLPILIPIFSNNKLIEHKSFVIEEPELNLFPVAQYEVIKLLEFGRIEPQSEDSGTIHTYTTHSPYILSAINNLLYANKVANYLVDFCEDESIGNFYEKATELINLVSKIVQAQINPKSFTSYQIYNGKAQSIFNKETGLIDENFIDEASDKIGDDFDALMELMSQYKHAVK